MNRKEIQIRRKIITAAQNLSKSPVVVIKILLEEISKIYDK